MPKNQTYTAPTIKDVSILTNNGPWPTKSNGYLNVLFGINFTDLQEKYFHYEESELNKISTDIRGLRSYHINGLKDKSFGANEWHRVRNELIFAIRGSVKWTCEDVYGEHREFIIDQKSGLWVPTFILHTYEARQDNTELLVVASTLFFPEDSTTHDSFSAIDFQNLQKHYSSL